MRKAGGELLELAHKRFGKGNLTDDEQAVIVEVAAGRVAKLPRTGEGNRDPTKADSWMPDQTVRSVILRWLCCSESLIEHIGARGIRIHHAKVIGRLNLEDSTVPFVVSFKECLFTRHIEIGRAKMKSFRLRGCQLKSLGAANLKCLGSIFLDDGFRSEGTVYFRGASIGGDVVCSGGRFESRSRFALSLSKANVGGSVWLDEGFRADAKVTLGNARIQGDLLCEDGHFTRSPHPSQADDETDYSAREDDSDELEVQPPTGNPRSLAFQRAIIGGHVFLGDGFESNGLVDFIGAEIQGGLSCSGGSFLNNGEDAIRGDWAIIGGDAAFNFIEQPPRSFQTNGSVKLRTVKIAGDVSFIGAKFIESSEGLDLRNASLSQRFIWNQVDMVESVDLRLSGASVGTLDMAHSSFPSEGHFFLDGLTYDLIEGIPANSKNRRTWLEDRLDGIRRQPESYFGFHPYSFQPYSQLARALDRGGYSSDSRRVLFERQEDLRRRGHLQPIEKAWNYLLRIVIGHGYYSQISLIWAAAFVLIGSIIFNNAFVFGLLMDTAAEMPERFYPIAYAIDTLVPIIDLRHADFWIPDGQCPALQMYYWFHISAGWILITLAAAGFTGLVRRD